MIDLNALPKITFAEKDAETILSELVARYEQYTGTTLYPGDPVRLFLSTIAYELVLQRNKIDFAAKMNLLAYATGSYLDHIGAMLGVVTATAIYSASGGGSAVKRTKRAVLKKIEDILD